MKHRVHVCVSTRVYVANKSPVGIEFKAETTNFWIDEPMYLITCLREFLAEREAS